MNKYLFLIVLNLLVLNINAQYTQIPDSQFEASLSSYDDIANDGQVPTANIQTVTRLDVADEGIHDLTGIEDFTSLEELYAYENSLSEIDLKNNTALKVLDLSQNNIKILDLTSNIALESVVLNDNSLSQLSIQNNNNENISVINLTNNTNLYCVQVDNPSYANDNWTNIDTQTTFNVYCQSLSVDLSVILEGAFEFDDSGMFPTLMRDDLNDGGYLPTTSPYSDAAIFEGSTFNGPGDRSIVDWVEVQLRNPDNINEILYRQSALLQQGGRIVALNTRSSLELSVWGGSYYIAVAHRNHLTIVSNTPYLLESFETLELDMKIVSNVFNGASTLVDMGDSYFATPTGDIDENGQVQNADISTTILEIGTSGYSVFDIDMNGEVQNTDVNKILQNLGKGEQF